MNRWKKGFTLIELIAVIIVIIILAAIALDRYGNISNGARNAVIRDFLQDCQSIRASMVYGNSQNNFGTTTNAAIQQFVSSSGFGGTIATLDSTGNILTLQNLPPKLFKTHETTLIINYQAQTYNGNPKDVFESLVQFN